MDELVRLQEKIGYTFKEISLLERALTHSSYSSDHYDRLEFLGDSIVNYVVSEMLYEQSGAQAGEMSKTRASIVSKEPLASLSDKLGFSDLCRRKNCSLSVKMKCDLFESVTAAIYLDGGMQPVATFVRKAIGTLQFRAVDYKSELKELCEKRRWSYHAPETLSESRKGKTFTVEVYVDSKSLGVGKGTSIRFAENEACKCALERLRKEGRL